MASIRSDIRRLASLGVSPQEIEQQLGIPPFTIHMHFHMDLMTGYVKYEERLQTDAEYKAQRRAEKVRLRNREHMRKMRRAKRLKKGESK